MWATHYWENNVQPGEIFYIWPGAVWYTISAHPTNLMGAMTKTQRGRELAKVVGGTVGAGALVAGTIAVPLALAPQAALVEGVASVATGEGIASAVGSGIDVACNVGRAGYEVIESMPTSSKDKKTVVFNLMQSFKDLDESEDDPTLEDVAGIMGWKISNQKLASLRRKWGTGHVKAFQYAALQAVRESKLSTNLKGVYAGNRIHRDGAFLEVTGLPYVRIMNKGGVKVVKRHISINDTYKHFETYKEECDLNEGNLTRESYENYFGVEKPRHLINRRR